MSAVVAGSPVGGSGQPAIGVGTLRVCRASGWLWCGAAEWLVGFVVVGGRWGGCVGVVGGEGWQGNWPIGTREKWTGGPMGF